MVWMMVLVLEIVLCSLFDDTGRDDLLCTPVQVEPDKSVFQGNVVVGLKKHYTHSALLFLGCYHFGDDWPFLQRIDVAFVRNIHFGSLLLVPHYGFGNSHCWLFRRGHVVIGLKGGNLHPGSLLLIPLCSFVHHLYLQSIVLGGILHRVGCLGGMFFLKLLLLVRLCFG